MALVCLNGNIELAYRHLDSYAFTQTNSLDRGAYAKDIIAPRKK